VRVRIGISESREIELDVEDAGPFKKEVETAFAEGSARVLWVVDTKGRSVGIPVRKIAYVEMEGTKDRPNVGFGGD